VGAQNDRGCIAVIRGSGDDVIKSALMTDVISPSPKLVRDQIARPAVGGTFRLIVARERDHFDKRPQFLPGDGLKNLCNGAISPLPHEVA